MCDSCVKDLWAEWTWCIRSLVSATGEPSLQDSVQIYCFGLLLDVCLHWSRTACFLLYVTITQRRSDQTIFIIVCTIACCIMSHFGRLEEFDCSSTDTDSYFERLHAFYRANNVHDTDSAKVDIFLSVVGPKTYKLLKSLIAPTLPSDKTIDELYQTLKRHVRPTDSSYFTQSEVLYKKAERHRKCHRLRSGAETFSSTENVNLMLFLTRRCVTFLLLE